MIRKVFFAAAAVTLSAVVSLLLLEVGVRVATSSLFEWRNYATDPINLVKAITAIEFDQDLGWVLKKDRPEFEQGQWRNRLHRTNPNGANSAPIYAVGDSFTYGSDVLADETWPAQLEQKINQPVLNGGVGGYGVDQIVLWAERMVPQVKPKILLVSFIANDITRTRMSIFSGATKPLYRVVDGELKPQNLPLQFYKPSLDYSGISIFLGYSKLIDWTMDRLGLSSRWRSSGFETRYETADDVETSCAFMKRLAALRVPTIVVGQHGWNDFFPEGHLNLEQVRFVLNCARTVGLTTIDTFDVTSAALQSRTPDDFKRMFVGGTGHMTPAGNAVVAGEIARLLGS